LAQQKIKKKGRAKEKKAHTPWITTVHRTRRQGTHKADNSHARLTSTGGMCPEA
jgi:hypothetical protein